MQRLAHGVLAALAAGTLAGCYAAVPVQPNGLQPGVPVVLTINDLGRVANADRMGGSVETVEGRLLARDTASYTLAVTQLGLLRGGTQVWTGERVRIMSAHVSAVAERRLAKGRTALLSAAAVGSVVLIARTSLEGLLSGDEAQKPTEPGISTRYGRH